MGLLILELELQESRGCMSEFEIGRAPCRERVLRLVELPVGVGSLKKKITLKSIYTYVHLP